MKRLKLLCILALLLAVTQVTWSQTVELAEWTFTNAASNWGPSPFPPSDSNNNVTIGGLTRGSGVTTQGTAAANAWGGAGFYDNVIPATSQSASTAAANGNFFTFSFRAKPGYTLSVTQIAAYNIRRSGTGPLRFIWQYSIDGTNFTDIGTFLETLGNTTDVGNAQSAIDLSTITALQNATPTTTITFRVLAWSTTSNGGTFYFNGGGANPSLIINGIVGSTPLPLNILSFKGKQENNINHLEWVTTDEKNVSHFELERGTNGYTFDKVATLHAKGNNTTANNHYMYKDAHAGTTAYYRLKMVDKDDKANYSDIVILRKGTIQSTINVYPNPAENTLFLEGLTNNSSYRITDALGREVISATALPVESTPISINISGLVHGIYFLQLTNDNGIETIRFIKK
jgi:hypothetical protein